MQFSKRDLIMNNNKLKSIHTSRTMMFAELEKVMDYSGDGDNFLESLGSNVTGKKSSSGVEKTANYLKRLYGFDMNYRPFEVGIKLATNGGFEFYEIINSNGNVVGQLSKPQGMPHEEKYKKQVALRKGGLKRFVINEIVQFSYDETLKSDETNGTNFAKDWCQEARNQAYIYLVDFAGFGLLSCILPANYLQIN